MSTSEKQPININIQGDNDISKTPVKDNYRDYIIETNMQLREENLRLRQEINETNNTISENEQEQDKYDNKVRYMKGLLNNLIEIKNQYTNVYRLEKTNHKTTIANIGEFSKIIYKFNREIIVCQLFIYLTAILMAFTTDRYFTFVLLKFVLIVFWFFKSGITGIKFYKKSDQLIKLIKDKVNIENDKITILIKQTQQLERETTSLDNWICEI